MAADETLNSFHGGDHCLDLFEALGAFANLVATGGRGDDQVAVVVEGVGDELAGFFINRFGCVFVHVGDLDVAFEAHFSTGESLGFFGGDVAHGWRLNGVQDVDA